MVVWRTGLKGTSLAVYAAAKAYVYVASFFCSTSASADEAKLEKLRADLGCGVCGGDETRGACGRGDDVNGRLLRLLNCAPIVEDVEVASCA